MLRHSEAKLFFENHCYDCHSDDSANGDLRIDMLATAAIAAFLDCGDFHAGFTRLHCPNCGHKFLVAFTCKQRVLCASCHQRRTLIEGALIADEISAPVPHRHLVLTLPRLIRHTFKFDRALLGELHHAAHSAITA